MLLSFSVANYRSFREEQTLSLLASKRLGPTEESPHCCEVPGAGEHALRMASLYGANGAGKSNLVRALALLKRLVLQGTAPGKSLPRQPFLLDEESPSKPTSFELQFVQEGEVFRYGLCYDAERVWEEWLGVYEGKKEHNLFARVTTKDGEVTVELGPPIKGVKHSQKIRALAEVGARPNQLFLTEVVNLDDPEAQGVFFERAIRWFSSTLTIVEPSTSSSSLAKMIASDEGFSKFASRFLRDADTGIAGVDVDTELLKSENSNLPPRVVARIIEKLVPGQAMVFSGEDGAKMFFEAAGKDAVKYHRIVALHDQEKGQPARLPLHEESDGSQRLLDLLPALHRLAAQGGVFVIDELERSMHPMLARKFIEFFLKAEGSAKSQLIFTTHETMLLNLDLMRRDGIWFAEKDPEGATHLYSLADFKVRKDLRIEKGYLEGRFGAIPFLGGIDHLIEEKASAEAKG